ncbi:hypothetical protein TNCV_1523111 [Trichonephila clavipes]|nr:hypothetical protein TNCV_1523111 [Trichonephila clavipes]
MVQNDDVHRQRPSCSWTVCDVNIHLLTHPPSSQRKSRMRSISVSWVQTASLKNTSTNILIIRIKNMRKPRLGGVVGLSLAFCTQGCGFDPAPSWLVFLMQKINSGHMSYDYTA